MLEAKFNYSWFRGNPIVKGRMKNLKPWMQWHEGTTALARVLGKGTGASPILIDHVIQGTFATSAKYLTAVIDNTALYFTEPSKRRREGPARRKAWGVIPVENPLLGIPFRGWLRTGPQRYNRFTEDFYEYLEQSTSAMASFTNLMGARGDIGDLEKLIDDEYLWLMTHKALTDVAESTKLITGEIERLRSPQLNKRSKEERRRLIDQLTKRNNELVRKAVEAMNELRYNPEQWERGKKAAQKQVRSVVRKVRRG
jgi:hypothetical protein